MPQQDGFSLIELIVVVSIAAIVLTFALPGFQRLIVDNQLTTSTNTFITSVNLARSEALRRAARVTLCKSANASTCTSVGSYAQGWVVFADDNSNAQRDTGEEVIRAGEAFSDGIKVSLPPDNGTLANYVSFIGDGTSRKVSGDAASRSSLKLCKDGNARVVFVNAIGRSRVETGKCSGT